MLYLTEKIILQLNPNFELAVQDCGVRKIMRRPEVPKHEIQALLECRWLACSGN